MRSSDGWLLGARPYLLLIGLCLLLYLPGLSAIPVLDRDEARFAQATRQMLETGDFLQIRFQHEARNQKPAGIYWLQAAAVGAFSTAASTAIWPYRLPSLIGATAAALLVFGLGAALFADGRVGGAQAPIDRRIGVVAAVLLATALGVVAEAHIAKTDAALLAAVVAGQGALGLAYVRGREGRPVRAWIAAVFWGAEIVAILLKGLPGPALACVTVAALAIADRDAGWLGGLRPLAGGLALVAIVAPWLMAIQLATDGNFLSEALGQDLAAKLIGGRESHGAPPFTYALVMFATFWPGSLLLVPALVRAWQRHDAPAERFLLAWLVPAWVFLELVPTKLPHYVMPLYPALALLAGAALAEGFRLPAASWTRRVEVASIMLWSMVGLALAVLLIGLPLRFGTGPGIVEAVGVVLLLGLTAAPLRAGLDSAAKAGLLAALSLAFVIPTAAAMLPGLDRLWLSRAAAGLVAGHKPAAGMPLVAGHKPAAGMPLVAVGYSEPSLVFMLGTGLRLMTAASAAAALGGGGEALVSSRDEPMFLQALAARGLVAQPLASVAGTDYSNGRRMVLTLYDVAPG